MPEHEHPFEITIVVNGEPTEVEAHPKQPLSSIIAPAFTKRTTSTASRRRTGSCATARARCWTSTRRSPTSTSPRTLV